jgi:hypothetical protein
MKVRIKATGEIKEVARGIYSPYQYVDTEGTIYTEDEVEELPGDDGVIFFDPTIDYWTRLEHQYAGMAMQGLMANLHNIGRLEGRTLKDEIVDIATVTAAALVKKLKEEK